MCCQDEASKSDLIERYASGEQNEIIYLSAYDMAKRSDEIIPDGQKADPDGHYIEIGRDIELIRDCPDVRLLINSDVDTKTVVTMLSKITEETEKYVEHLRCSFVPKYVSKETEEDKRRRISKILYINALSKQDIERYLSEFIKNSSK